ncbi:MAG: prepilin-type N-terminal cleavage/methylation domain-containing protein [Candidatus Thiodiazotropha sp.]|jgi:prepilin-type N-terminal cleavage/methylation domain-containing protein
MNNRQHKTVGFTLIEMVIVIAIIGVIVAIALPNYEKYIRKAC